jgi:uncharacterized protein (TIGR03790 family)
LKIGTALGVKSIANFFLVAVCALLFSASSVLALQPDEILLITNKNVAESGKLAAVYCQLRGVPATQIVALDLPMSEEMPFETYETAVVGPVRKFLNDNKLHDKVKCLLTFYGVPFRVLDKRNSPDENRELAMIRDVGGDTSTELKRVVGEQEQQAARLDPAFVPGAGDTVPAMLARSSAAISAASSKITSMQDRTAATVALKEMIASLQQIGGPAEIDGRLGRSQREDTTKTLEQQRIWIDLHQNVLQAREDVQRLQGLRWDSDARSQLRQVARKYFGLVGLIRVLDSQVEYFATTQTGAATDSELALLWWDYYPRQKWVDNPMLWSFIGRAAQPIMTMRLDGPDAKTVERMMRTSVKVEQTGLQGIIAIDARGKAPIDDKGNLDVFGEFDETLRHLAEVVRLKTPMKIKLDDQDLVFPPHSVKNVALYCGWYSVSNYIPGCDFNPGAVGYHVASYELTSLHSPSSLWVRGLLNDGVVATLGAVAEPYLSAFPKPDDFFPLLLTGKLTMAEVYWKTTPMASWMITFIGDPLYTPYKQHPLMKVEDLPPGLRRVFKATP